MTAAGFPFSAVLGMDDMRLALLLNAVDPAIGGVLVRGEKGTAKSTAVRALAALLPPVAVVAGCRFGCDPARPDPGCPDGPHGGDEGSRVRPGALVELPVGASEDRVIGSLDLERVLRDGVRAFEPGLLAAAHRGVLYVDEVNLLHDHLVDLLLDAAAMGRCHVEREGVSVSHAARFLLVGTMNPEEGELRPQLLDRFGLTVEVAASRDPALRVEVVRRRLAADADPAAFAAQWREADAEVAARVVTARELLAKVELPDAALRQIAEVCAAFDVDGMRADIVTARAACAHAAWQGRAVVGADDVRVAARLALPHRRRRNPFDAPGLDTEQLEQILRDTAPQDPDDPGPDDPGPEGGGPDNPAPDGGGPGGGRAAEGGPSGSGAPEAGASESGASEAGAPGPTEAPGAPQQPPHDRDPDGRPASGRAPAAQPAPPEPLPAAQRVRARLLTARGVGQGVPGRRSAARTGFGRTVGARRPGGRVERLHLVATVTAAAPHQHARGRRVPGPLRLRSGDLREAVRHGREGNLVLFVVDASGSMAARRRMQAVKGAVLALLLDAYQRRDKVAVVTFAGGGAELALPPTSSVDAAVARLAGLRTGGRTPLAEGLLTARRVLDTERVRDPRRRPLVVVVTDGRATEAGRSPAASRQRAGQAARWLAASGATCVVVDCESGPVRLGLARELAVELTADHHPLAEIAAGALTDLVQDTAARQPGTERKVG